MTDPPILHLAAPRGFCAGVERAIETVELALRVYGRPVHVRHEIVHNRHVVEDLSAKGAVFTDDLATVPAGAVLVLSAHGVSPAVRREAEARGLRLIDATCPLVTRVHLEALRQARDGCTVVLVGHRRHVEVQGTLGEAPEAIVVVETVAEAEALPVTDPAKVAYVVQTTLSVDDSRVIVETLRRRFPALREPARGICYATQNRQNAVKELARRCRIVFVVGAPGSSNANRLVEVARALGATAHLVQGPADVLAEWLAPGADVGVTAGASTPEDVVQACVARLQALGGYRVEPFRLVEETIAFPLPATLLDEARARGVDLAAGGPCSATRAGGAGTPC
jgi:4-hydroxy-3-methylbut-2-en-1-yl diphosphate reductase